MIYPEQISKKSVMNSSTVRIHGVGVPASKLRPPRVRHSEVSREGLLDRISVRSAEILAVQAPAGYGKSTLAIQWASATKRPVAWVTVDASDNDPVVLIGSLAAALCTAVPEYRPPEVLVSDEPAYSRVVLPSFLGSVATLAAPVTLVLDDLHQIEGQAARRVLRALVEALPTGSQIALLGRDLHAVPLALWRGQGRMAELHAADLAFTIEESRIAVRGFHCKQDAADIHHAAGGWPVAVFLISQSATAAQFADIEDFIEQEVLAPMPGDLRDFVLATAPLGSVSSDLARFVTGQARANHYLAEAITTVLLQPSESGWFVYHPLMQECVTGYLEREDPARLSAVRARAAQWHLQAGLLDTAVRLAVAAGDEQNLGSIMWEAARPTLLHGRARTVQLWLDLVDPVVIDRVAALSLAAAWANVATGQYSHAGRHGRRTLDLLPSDWRENAAAFPFVGHLAMLQAATWLDVANPLEGLAAAELACRRIGADDPVCSLAVLTRGVNRAILGDPAAEGDILQAIGLADSMGVPSTKVEALAMLGLLRLANEQETPGCDAIERAVEIFAFHDLSQLATSSALLSLARVALTSWRGRECDVREAMAQHAQVRSDVESVLPWYGPLSAAVLAEVAVRLEDLDLYQENLRTAERSCLVTDGLCQKWASLARRRHAASSPLSALTPAELRVWDLLQSRMTLTEIAGSLYLSRETVKSHTSAIYRKLGVATRREAQELADSWQ